MHRLVAIAAILLVVGSGFAQSPEDNYVLAYNQALQADALGASGNDRQAIAKYVETQSSLKKLQEEFPTWNPALVKYRLDDVTTKLEALAKKSGIVLPSAKPAGDLSKTGPVSTRPADQLTLLENQLRQLTGQNSLLEAKLKEALSVQPAALDPRELAKAEGKIRDLEKENGLLKLSLNQAKQTPAPTIGLEADDQALAQAQKKIAEQGALISLIQRERASLQTQADELRGRLPAPTADESGALLSSLQASNQALRAELALAHNTIGILNKQTADRSSAAPLKEQQKQITALQSDLRKAREESGALRKKLDDEKEKSRRRKTGASADQSLAQQLEVSQAKLGVLEAQRVAYSPEELALLQALPSAISAAQTATPRKPRELPAGAGQLMAEADRAIDAGRLEEAEKKYREVLRQDENNVVVLARLAAVLLDRGHLDEAEKHLKKALASDPEDSGTLYLMGSIRARQEKYDEALEHLSLSAKHNPDNPQTQFLLGRVLAQKGQRVPAETALRKAILLKPNWGEAHYALAVVYATQEPAFKELAQWHYEKARAAGIPANAELEKAIEKVAKQ